MKHLIISLAAVVALGAHAQSIGETINSLGLEPIEAFEDNLVYEMSEEEFNARFEAITEGRDYVREPAPDVDKGIFKFNHQLEDSYRLRQAPDPRNLPSAQHSA